VQGCGSRTTISSTKGTLYKLVFFKWWRMLRRGFPFLERSKNSWVTYPGKVRFCRRTRQDQEQRYSSPTGYILGGGGIKEKEKNKSQNWSLRPLHVRGEKEAARTSKSRETPLKGKSKREEAEVAAGTANGMGSKTLS